MNKHKVSKTNHDHELNDLVHKFNIVIIGMINHVTEYYGDISTASLRQILTDIIIDTPDEPISYFILNIYKNDDYRINILKQNDKLCDKCKAWFTILDEKFNKKT